MARLSIRIGNDPDLGAGDFRSLALMAEERGYETLWMTEGSGGRDTITQLTAIACATSRINVAPGILPIFGRTPMMTAMSAAGLAAVSEGRFILGLGVGNRHAVESAHGVPYRRPLDRLRETISISRRLLAGETVDHQGRVFEMEGASLGEVLPDEPVPIYIAALGPRMLELAGEMADGVLLSWTGGDHLEQSIERVYAGAKRAGRDPSEIDIAGYVRVAVVDDPQAAVSGLRRQVSRYTRNPYYRAFFRQCGYDQEIAAIEQAFARGDVNAAAEAVSPEMQRALAVIGTPGECREQLEAMRSMGLQQPVVAPFPVGDSLASHERAIAAFGG